MIWRCLAIHCGARFWYVLRQLFFAGCLTLALGQVATAQSTPKEISQARDAVFRVLVGPAATASSGTAFAISDNLLVTNEHVVEDVRAPHPDLYVWNRSQGRRNITSITILAGADLALLEIAGEPVPTLPLFLNRAEQDKDVWAMGCPGTSAAGIARPIAEQTSGTMQDYSDDASFAGIASLVIRHTAEIFHGSSGGPLLTRCGSVIGINTAILRTGPALAPGLSKVSVPSFVLVDLARSQGIPLDHDVFHCSDEASRTAVLLGANFDGTLGLFLGALALSTLTLGLLFRDQIFPRNQANSLRNPSITDASFTTSANETDEDHGHAARPEATPLQEAVRFVVLSSSTGETSTFAELNMQLRSVHTSWTLLIGRDPEKTSSQHDTTPCFYLQLDDKRASRAHVKLTWDGRTPLAEDMGSKNGTICGDQILRPGTPVELSARATLRIGSTGLNLLIQHGGAL